MELWVACASWLGQAVMDGQSQKQAYYGSTSSLRGRTASGSATRGDRFNEPPE